MRCSCQICGTYMVHSESLELGSGCGKSTAGRTILRLIEKTSGEVIFDGQDIFKMSREELRALKRDPAMIAQLFSDPEEPEERFNPDEFGRE